MNSKICMNRTRISVRGFDHNSVEDVSFVDHLFNRFEKGSFLDTICPCTDQDKLSRWGTKHDITKASEVHMLEHGELLMGYDTTLTAPIEAFKHAVSRGGIWDRVTIHTLFVNESLGVAGEWIIRKDDVSTNNIFLPKSGLTSAELALFLEVLEVDHKIPPIQNGKYTAIFDFDIRGKIEEKAMIHLRLPSQKRVCTRDLSDQDYDKLCRLYRVPTLNHPFYVELSNEGEKLLEGAVTSHDMVTALHQSVADKLMIPLHFVESVHTYI